MPCVPMARAPNIGLVSSRFSNKIANQYMSFLYLSMCQCNKLWEDIQEKGETELFSQSEKTEPYERERPSARLFTSTDKNYQAIIKQLNELTPPSKKGGKLEQLKNDG